MYVANLKFILFGHLPGTKTSGVLENGIIISNGFWKVKDPLHCDSNMLVIGNKCGIRKLPDLHVFSICRPHMAPEDFLPLCSHEWSGI